MKTPSLGEITYKAVYLPVRGHAGSIVSAAHRNDYRQTFEHTDLAVVEHWVMHQAIDTDRDREDFSIRQVVETRVEGTTP